VTPRAVVAAALALYQRAISPLLGPNCRYYPSCSQYAKEAVLKYGVRRGVALAAWRVVRCNPWNPGGVDFVP
jgi:putative membrane protein insertion efficiency factor